MGLIFHSSTTKATAASSSGILRHTLPWSGSASGSDADQSVPSHQEIQRPVQSCPLAGVGDDVLTAGKPEGIIQAERPAIQDRAVAGLSRIAENGGMPGNASPTSTLMDATFRSMEGLNEFAHSMGREGQISAN